MINNETIENRREMTQDEKRCYEMFVQEMIKIISIYGKDALDAIENKKTRKR